MALVQLLVLLALAAVAQAGDGFGGWQSGRATHYGTDGEYRTTTGAVKSVQHHPFNRLHTLVFRQLPCSLCSLVDQQGQLWIWVVG